MRATIPAMRLASVARLVPLLMAGCAGITSWVGARSVPNPWLYLDEAGYLLTARAVAGNGQLSGMKYYPGYGFMTAPSFLGDLDPLRSYRLVQAINVVLGLALVVLVARLLKHFDTPTRAAWSVWVVAAAVACYPPLVLFRSMALSENALAVLPVALALLVAQYQVGPGPKRAWACGFLAGFALLLHARALVLPVAAVLAVVLLSWGDTRRVLRDGVSVVAGTTIGLGLAWPIILAYTESVGSDPGKVGGKFDSFRDVFDVPVAMVGQLVYLVAATAGLLVVGWLACYRLARGPSHPAKGPAIFLGLCAAGTLILSSISVSGSPGDFAIYGRYNEAVIVGPLAVGLMSAGAGVVRRTEWYTIGGGFGILVAILIGRYGVMLYGRKVPLNIAGLYPVVAGSEAIPLLAIGLAGGAGLGVAALLARRPLLLPAAFLVVGAIMGVWTTRDYAGRSSRAWGSQHELVHVLERFQQTGLLEGECIGLDRSDEFLYWHRTNYRVLGPELPYEDFWSASEGSPCSVVITSRSAHFGPEVRLGGREAFAQFSLLLLDEDMADVLSQEGLSFPANSLKPAATALRAELRLADAPSIDTDAGALSFELVVTHTGSGSPWAPGNVGGDKLGVVRLGVSFPTGSSSGEPHRVELGRQLFPGESVELRVLVDLPVGDPDVTFMRLELVSEGVTWFGPEGRLDVPLAGG